MGQAPAGDTYNQNGDGVPLIAGAGDFKNGVISVSKYTSKPTKLSQKYDILISIRASIGAKVWSDGEYCLGRGVAAIRAGGQLDTSFLWHWLSHVEALLVSKGKGATFPQVNRDDLTSLEMVIPPLDEQRRIAAILDQADAIRTKRQQLLVQLESLVTSIFSTYVATHGREEPLGKLLKSADKFTDGDWVESKDQDPNGSTRLIQLADIGDGIWLNKSRRFMNQETVRRLKCTTLEPGDVLVARMPDPLGRACVFPGLPAQAVTAVDVCIIRASLDVLHPAWLVCALNSKRVRERIDFLATGTTRKRISRANLATIQVPIAEIEIQKEFAARVQKIEEQRRLVEAALKRDNELFASLQERAFSGGL